ncbi:unnamed protein product [Polarella glacialis]|uniref:Vacuolar protein 14 C-terminal Fig4-binding domain-containing protein n=1 Tax=Polarella glacialis TaxID=89957 RepID=A0A813JWN6_POLGL|nr:unnamed protein product [Polarella glacialis]
MASEESPLTASVRSNLCDKSSDKRKQAALDIEIAVRHALRGSAHSAQLSMLDTALYAVAFGSSATVLGGSYLGAAHEQVARLIRCLAIEFCGTAFPSRRKGGLMGLASVAIALEHRPAQLHVAQLVDPVLTCFSDEDAGVRYSACEAFYNITKVARGGILPQLLAVFDGLCRLYTDVDQSVKDGAQCLDRLVRDVVTECRDFDYSKFIPLLTARIRVLNPSVRQLVLGWIVLLDTLPQVDMIVYLPQYLEGLFGILASDNRDIRHNAEVCLAELLDEIRGSATERPARAQRAVADAASTVARCCRAGERRPEDNYVRLMALHWLLEFVKLQVDLESTVPAAAAAAVAAAAGDAARFTGNAVSEEIYQCHPSVRLRLACWLPPRAAVDQHQDSVQAAESSTSSGSSGLRQLIPELLSGALYCLDDGEGEIRQNAQQANAALQDAAKGLCSDLPVEAISRVLLDAMSEGVAGQERSQEVLLKCFGWAELLLNQCPVQVLERGVRDELLDTALAALLRPEDEVASASLRLIARLAAPSDDSAGQADNEPAAGAESDNNFFGVPRFLTQLTAVVTTAGAESRDRDDLFGRMCKRLFGLLADRPSLLSSRGELVVRRLCDGVDAERFFATAARAVVAEKDPVFARRLVQVLNRGLWLTGRETRKLRAKLRAEADLSGDALSGSGEPLAMVLLSAWLHCPVSALALCLWMNWFELAAELALRLAEGRQAELGQAELQAQLTEFVELLDSPVFTSVRLQLLEAQHRPELLKAVLRLVALLPEDRSLGARLQLVETGLLLDKVTSQPGPSKERACPAEATLLLSRFDEVSTAHRWQACVL